MERKKDYSDYMLSGHKILKLLFPKHMNSITRVKTKPIDITQDEDIVEVTTSSITAVVPNVEERFSENWVEYEKDHGRPYAIDQVLKLMFHYGYQSAMEHEVEKTIDMQRIHLSAELLKKFHGLDRETKNKLSDAGVFDLINKFMFPENE